MEGTFSLLDIFKRSEWRPAAGIERPFVRHLNPDPSPGEYCCLPPRSRAVHISVVIPTLDAHRNGYFEKLLHEMDSQTLADFEVIVVKGDNLQGRAINLGASIGIGKYLLTLDDDTALPDKDAFSKLFSVMETCPEIGMAGGMNVIPPDATWLTRRVMREIPRRYTPPLLAMTDSDLAEHPLLIMRHNAFKEVGGENELLPRGLDPYLRQEFRNSGYRIVVVPEARYSHLPPRTLTALVRQFYRNGKHASFVHRRYPQWAIETPGAHGHFISRVSFIQRTARYPKRMITALLQGRWIYLTCMIAYATGFTVQVLERTEREESR